MVRPVLLCNINFWFRFYLLEKLLQTKLINIGKARDSNNRDTFAKVERLDSVLDTFYQYFVVRRVIRDYCQHFVSDLVFFEEIHNNSTEINTGIYPSQRLKSKEHFPIVLIIVNKVASDRHNCLLKRRGLTI